MPERFAGVARATGEVDAAFVFILIVTLFFFLITQGLLIYFALKYRRRKKEEERETPYITGHHLLEIVWIIVPTAAVIAIFIYGYVVYDRITRPVPGAQEIGVVARQWSWEFRYPDGRRAMNELRVPAGEPVRLVMTSEDVIHSFYVPQFRQKMDVLPGRYTELFLQPVMPGTYDVYCAEYCGLGHAQMLAKLVVMEKAEYEAWVEEERRKVVVATPAERGAELLEELGCLGCHSTDGTVRIGPTLQGLFGRTVTLDDGTTVTADENYIRESILDPMAKIVEGFPPVMPTYKGVVTEEDIAAMIAYIKVLSGIEPEEEAVSPAERGRQIAEQAGCLGCHSTDGTVRIGPTLQGLFGRTVTLDDGTTVTADENYIRESILDPNAKIVRGFQPVMPSYEGRLSEEEVAALIAYIETLK
jgi:cytochrome c oxidase subunit II